MKEIKFSFDEDNGEKKDGKEAEVIDLSEYREYIKEFFAEKETDDVDEDFNEDYDSDEYTYDEEQEMTEETKVSDDDSEEDDADEGGIESEDDFIGFGGDMEPDNIEKREFYIDIWKQICQKKIDEAYREYKNILCSKEK